MRRLAMIAFVVFTLLFGSTLPGSAQFSELGGEQFKIAVNAPDFTLKELGGGKISLRELRGKVVVLNFFATY